MKWLSGHLSKRPSSDISISHYSRGRSRINFAASISISSRRAFAVFLLPMLITLSALPAQGADTKKVVFIRYSLGQTSISTALNSFRKTMANRGYLEGKNIEYVEIITQDPGRESVLEILDATDTYKDSTDMFITISWVSLYSRSKLAGSDVPQLFVPVLRSVALNMLPSLTEKPGTNLSGVYLNYPPEKLLRLTRLILPGIKNYAYVYDSSVPADLIFKSEFSKLSAEEQHGIHIHFIDLASGIDKALAELKKKKIEALGGVIGAFKNRKALDRSGLPIITSLLLDVDRESLVGYIRDSNIIAGLYNPFEYCGEQAAQMTADIFDRKKTIEETIPRPARQSAFVNLKSADRLNIPIPFAALEAVDFVIK